MLSRSCSVLVLALLACGSPEAAGAPPPSSSVVASEPVPTVAPIPPPASTVPPPPPTAAEPRAVVPSPTAEIAAAPPPTVAIGLPPVTIGPAIHLENLPVTTRDVDGRHVPSVALADPAATARLDAWFAEASWCHGRPQLAIEGFVSYTCTYFEPAAGGDAQSSRNVRIDADGTATEIHVEDVFLPGTDLTTMLRVWADAGLTTSLRDVTFGPAGAIARSLDDDEDTIRIPWRTLAPYVRADGPLGPPLVAAGLTLAPPGTQAVMPLPATIVDFPDVVAAMRAAAGLTPEDRARTQLRASGDGASLVRPLGAPAMGHARDGYRYGVLADLVSVRMTGAAQVHEEAGPRSVVTGALPIGTVAIAVRGAIGARTSELGTGWVLVATPRGTAGWVQGRDVVANDGCGALGGVPYATSGYVDLAPDAHFAWVIVDGPSGAQKDVTIFSVGEACAIGAQARQARVEGDVTELHLVRVAADADDWWLVIVVAPDLALPARTIAVIGPEAGAAPLYTTTTDAPVLRFGERHGPDHATGYFPLTIASGATHTWLSWNGQSVEVVSR